jgi:hypothetical protein
MKVGRDEFAIMSDKIIEVFPTESVYTYYDTRDKKCSGALRDKYYNIRVAYKKIYTKRVECGDKNFLASAKC